MMLVVSSSVFFFYMFFAPDHDGFLLCFLSYLSRRTSSIPCTSSSPRKRRWSWQWKKVGTLCQSWKSWAGHSSLLMSILLITFIHIHKHLDANMYILQLSPALFLKIYLKKFVRSGRRSMVPKPTACRCRKPIAGLTFYRLNENQLRVQNAKYKMHVVMHNMDPRCYIAHLSCQDYICHYCLHHRRNVYDGEEEFWCVIKESGKRKEEQSYEEVHKRQKQAM